MKNFYRKFFCSFSVPKLFFYLLLLFFSKLSNAQSIQIFTEDFQLGGNSFTLNSSGPGTNSGLNQWIINNNYNGAPTYPNTMPQDSTYGGTIGFAPNSQYLHIFDSNSGISNCNYNSSATSDQFAFMTTGLCTYGIDSVHFSFFYLCEGSATAFGKVYYSANNGPWIQIGQAQYNNKYKWQYEDITDPAFSNVGSLRFGFRFENDNSGSSNTESFAIDDIDIVGSFNTINNPISITVTSVIPNPVCQGALLTIFYNISDTLCDGSYILELSNSNGNFPGNNSWIFNVYYPQMSGAITVQLNSPPVPQPGTCYKVRISRNSPAPAITGTISACFEIKSCPNVITTNQPVVTYDTNAVCSGSVIEVPFYSTGVYSFNTYTAQLSDSDGNFPTTPKVVGTFGNSTTYDPNLPPYKPGTVSGLVPVVPPGCNYFLRVVSSNPAVVGAPWGPFCIGNCDLTTNNKQSLQFCVTDCAISPEGADTNITVDIHSFDSVAVYNPGNEFKIELLNKKFFTPVGPLGAIGKVASVNDTLMLIHIPCKDSLAIIGVPPGSYYGRLIATNSTVQENSLGTLINISIGAPHAIPPVITAYNYNTFLPEDTFCSNEQVGYYFYPYDFNDMSTYQWQSPQFFGGNPFSQATVGNDPNSNQNPYVFTTDTGYVMMRVRETNFGCSATWSVFDTVQFFGPPAITISGPALVCIGDTNHYQVQFFDNTYYNWTANNANIIDTSNNEIDLQYNTIGNYQIKISALNICGVTNKTKVVQVKPFPLANAGSDTMICSSDTVSLSTNTGIGYFYTWSDGVDTIGTTASVYVNPDSTTNFFLTVKGPGGCKTFDTVTVFAIPKPEATAGDDTTICLSDSIVRTSPFSSAYVYLWTQEGLTISTNNSATLFPQNTTTYNLLVTDSTGCINRDSVIVTTQIHPVADAGPDYSICENSDITLTTQFQVIYNYLWTDIISNTISTSNNANVSPDSATMYLLKVTDNIGCESKDTITIFTFSYPVANAGPDKMVCLNDSVTLAATTGNNYTFQWSDGSAVLGSNSSLTISPQTNQDYFLSVTGTGDCKTFDTVSVQVQFPVSYLFSDSICPDGDSTLSLVATSGSAFLWTTGETSKQISVNSLGIFSVTISHPDSVCKMTETFEILPAKCPEFIIVLPNVFTPNGDGFNNNFTPIISAGFDPFNIKIYNRWGTLIYDSNDPFFKWNGNNKKGEPLSDGTYFYIVEAAHKTELKKLTGYVNLIR